MIGIPNEPLSGQPVQASDMAMILRYAKSAIHRGSPGQLVSTGAGGTTRRNLPAKWIRRWPSPSGGSAPWPFKGYNTTINTPDMHIPQMQFNGGDGSLASLGPTDGIANGVACVNGNRTDMATGSPAVYPQLAIPGNGYVYVKVWLNPSGQVTPGSSSDGTGVDILFAADATPPPDTSSPPTFGTKQLGTVTNYTIADDGTITFTYNDATGPVGVTTVQVCFGTVLIT